MFLVSAENGAGVNKMTNITYDEDPESQRGRGKRRGFQENQPVGGVDRKGSIKEAEQDGEKRKAEKTEKLTR